MMTKTKQLLALLGVGILCACGEAPAGFDGSMDTADSMAQPLISEITNCGSDGTTRYELSCDELQASCAGTFTCLDEYASRDGSCSYGMCEVLVDEISDGSTDTSTASDSKAATIKYGPVITIKPKG